MLNEGEARVVWMWEQGFVAAHACAAAAREDDARASRATGAGRATGRFRATARVAPTIYAGDSGRGNALVKVVMMFRSTMSFRATGPGRATRRFRATARVAPTGYERDVPLRLVGGHVRSHR